MSVTWQDIVEHEMLSAREAQQANHDGRSRVSARRAAGYAVKEYFRLCDPSESTDNIYHLLHRFSEYPGLPDDILTIARHLCQRVDENHSLPGEINLISETELLISYLSRQIKKANNYR